MVFDWDDEEGVRRAALVEGAHGAALNCLGVGATSATDAGLVGAADDCTVATWAFEFGGGN